MICIRYIRRNFERGLRDRDERGDERGRGIIYIFRDERGAEREREAMREGEV